MCTKKKLDENYTRMLRAIFNKSWKKHPSEEHLAPILKTIQDEQDIWGTSREASSY